MGENKMFKVDEKKPEDGILVLTCIWVELKSGKMEPFQWRTLRYSTKGESFRCPYQHSYKAPTHWTYLPNWKGEKVKN